MREFNGRRSPVVRFERAAVKRFREYGIPVFASEMTDDAVQLLHCQWLDRLSLGELNIYLRLGLDAAASANVNCSWAPRSSYSWEVAAKGGEGELMPGDYRHLSRDEINAIADKAAEKAQLIIALQEDIEAAQKALRDEMDRQRLSRLGRS